jgi:hypothetical protein
MTLKKGYEISSYNELRFRRIETYGHDVQESVIESANNLQMKTSVIDVNSDLTTTSSQKTSNLEPFWENMTMIPI